jgi:hypothetical protein
MSYATDSKILLGYESWLMPRPAQLQHNETGEGMA